MAAGTLEDTITDMDFLETLGMQACFIVPPYVLSSSADGSLAKIARLVYTTEGRLDKPKILLEVAKAVRKQKAGDLHRRRFSM